MKIDSHQHFWQFNPIRDAWIDDNMKVLRHDFMPENLQPLLAQNGIDGCVAVQADQSEPETEFLLDLADNYDSIKAVVGWVDILSDDMSERLERYSQNPFFKGIRHIAQGEEDGFLKRSEVINGIAKLEKFGLTYDVLVYAHQLPAAIELVKSLPNQAFVLDHIAKPKISEGLDAEWVSNIKQLASYSNVFCKVSGMVTETKNYKWTFSDFTPFLDVIIDSFGVDRVMYGSDWPVCLLAADYKEQLTILLMHIENFSSDDQAKIMGGNAVSFYNIN